MSNFKTDASIDDLFIEELENEEKKFYRTIYSNNSDWKSDKNRRDLVNIITKLHNHNKNIREAFYIEKTQLLNMITQLEAQIFNKEKEIRNYKIITEENLKLTGEIKSLKMSMSHLEILVNNTNSNNNNKLRNEFEESIRALTRENEFLMQENQNNKNNFKNELWKINSNYQKQIEQLSSTNLNPRNEVNRNLISSPIVNTKPSYQMKNLKDANQNIVNLIQLNNNRIRSNSNSGQKNNYLLTNINKEEQKERYYKLSEVVNEIRKLENDIQNNTKLLKEIEFRTNSNNLLNRSGSGTKFSTQATSQNNNSLKLSKKFEHYPDCKNYHTSQNKQNIKRSFSLEKGDSVSNKNLGKYEMQIMEILEQQSVYLLELKKRYNEISKLH